MAVITLKPKDVYAEMMAVFKVRKKNPRVEALKERFEEEEHAEHEDRQK